MNKISPTSLQLAQVQRLWRRWRRIHAARAPSERRILLLGAVAITWFLMDTVLLTPALDRFKVASNRYNKATSELRQKQDQQRRYNSDMVAITAQLKGEVDRLRGEVAQQKTEIDAFQSGLVPAREMREFLNGVLSSQPDLLVLSMKTLSQEDVRKAMPGVKEMPGLFRHGVELKLQGRYQSLYQWLQTMENWPRKVMWSGMKLELDERSQLTLTVTLFTLSPDVDPLEIAAP